MKTTLLALLIEAEDKEKTPVINDQTFIVIMVIGIAVLAAVLFVALALWLPKFQRELKHVNQRIQNSGSERERNHYLKRRRNLWLSLFIPFIKYKYR